MADRLREDLGAYRTIFFVGFVTSFWPSLRFDGPHSKPQLTVPRGLHAHWRNAEWWNGGEEFYQCWLRVSLPINCLATQHLGRPRGVGLQRPNGPSHLDSIPIPLRRKLRLCRVPMLRRLTAAGPGPELWRCSESPPPRAKHEDIHQLNVTPVFANSALALSGTATTLLLL